MIETIHDALRRVVHPRFFETERGFQGAFQANLHAGLTMSSTNSPAGRRRRKISAAGRAAITAVQKKRWAAIKRKMAAGES